MHCKCDPIYKFFTADSWTYVVRFAPLGICYNVYYDKTGALTCILLCCMKQSLAFNTLTVLVLSMLKK